MYIETTEIIDFLKELSGCKDILPDSDIFEDLGVTGNDFHEMIEKFAYRYSINMQGYLWYFHTDEEGHGFGNIFFAPPYERVKRIPVTPKMLSEFASNGIWEIKYPKHELPKRRYDFIINQIVVGTILLAIVIWIIFKLIK
jgi:hypothetical protein